MRAAVVGLGIMGGAMVSRLLSQGFQVSVYNRTREKAEQYFGQGAEWRNSPRDAAVDADIVITFVTDISALHAVSLGENGILAGLGPEAVHCEMSTIAPPAAVDIARSYASKHRRYVQAPVLGSWRQILDGSLLVFGGGAAADLDRCAPAWEAFAKKIWRFDTAQQSAAAKLACNILIGQMIIGLGQSLAMAGRGGVDAETMLDILAASNLASPMYASKGNQIATRMFKPNFTVKNMLKDLRLASDYAADINLALPSNAANREQFVKAIDEGFGDLDYSAVVMTMLKDREA